MTDNICSDKYELPAFCTDFFESLGKTFGSVHASLISLNAKSILGEFIPAFFMCLCVHPRVDVNSTEKRGVQSEAMSLRGMSLLLHEKPCLHSGDFQVFTEIVWVGCRCVTSHRGIFFFQFFHHDFKLHFHQAKPTLLSHLSVGDILGIYSHEKKKKSWSAIIHFGAI